MPREKNDLNYGSYLKIEELLSLQETQSIHVHDEMMFIITHQTYELWFKQIIHELSFLKKILEINSCHQVLSCLKRIKHIFKIITAQTDILETMLPLSFQSFRGYLGQASGLQSFQFRVFTFMLGIKNEKYINNAVFTEKEKEKLQMLYNESSLWEDFISFFKMNLNDSSQSNTLDNRHHLLTYIYQNPSIYTEICEYLLDLDEGLQEWRYRHVKLVERMIGGLTPGTGSTSGVDYLKNTVFLSFCPELWEIRNKL